MMKPTSMLAAAATPAAPAAKATGGLARWLDYELVTFANITLTPGKLGVALLMVAVAWLLSRAIRMAIARVERRQGNGQGRSAALYTLSRMVHYSLLVIGIMFALDVIGFSASRFAVLAGALGVGLGFGLQAIFNNFVSGLILLFDRSIKVGDFVELESGVHGEVGEIRSRVTRITTNDNIDILVPNSEFVNGRVTNWTLGDFSRRLRVPFSVAYGSDKEKVKSAALEAAREVGFTLAQEGDRRPQVWLAEFGDSSLNFELAVWLTAEATKRPSAVRAAYNWALETSLARHGLEIPFPQRDLHIRSAFGLEAQAARAAFSLQQVADDAPPRAARVASPTGTNDALEDVQREIEEDREAQPREARAKENDT